jgi:glucosylceramidase
MPDTPTALPKFAVTFAAARMQPQPAPRWEQAADTPDAEAVTVDPEERHQLLLGFGAAFTDAACFVLSAMPSAERDALLRALLTTEGLALSVCRTCVGQSDYGVADYSYAETPDDWTLADWTMAQDDHYIVPILQEALRLCPDLFLFSSPWSPPGWMKTSGRMRGGWMRGDCLEVFAEYYRRYLHACAERGIPIRALTVQNEPQTDQGGLMPACFWHPDFERALIRDFLGPKLRADGLDTQIWLLDHNYSDWERADRQLADPALRPYVAGAAFHPYGGKPEMMARLAEHHPGLSLHWTEGGPNLPLDESYTDEWCHWGKTMTEALRNGCRSWTAWNLALDETGGPNLGPFHCAGLVTVYSGMSAYSGTSAVRWSGQARALAHFSRFLRRGACRIGSERSGPAGELETNALHHAAFQNPDGGIVLVLTNPGSARALRVAYRGRQARLSLPEDSLATLCWPAPGGAEDWEDR